MIFQTGKQRIYKEKEKSITRNEGEIKSVILALKNSDEITDQTMLYSKILIRECQRLNLKYYPAFWSLGLKGIDDYYAYHQRNIQYNNYSENTKGEAI